MKRTLYYFYDPMCSWCYAFKPVLKRLRENLPSDIAFVPVLGGLAPDTENTMPESMQQRIQQTWKQIEKKVPGTCFNYGFWNKCRPMRSTWPACRAVLAAEHLAPGTAEAMNNQIQKAYYQQAKNPSLHRTLVDCALDIGLPSAEFEKLLSSKIIEQALQQQLKITQDFSVNSFPGLKLKVEQSIWPIAIDYTDEQIMLEEIEVVSSL